MSLTIGMAVYDDFDGAYFSLQSLRMYHSCEDVELIVVDNNPSSPSGQAVKALVENWLSRGNLGARYIAMPEATGTTQPRQRVFDEARGDAVLCMDSHVLIAPGAISRLLEFYRAHPDCPDLLSGPMLYDDLHNMSTQFNDVWRAEMWGVWGTDSRGADPSGQPFEVWGQGLGLFTCRRDAWLGFNPHFRGFGGEEGYIHHKFRQAGRKCLCLPWLRWAHRFGRPNGVKYPLTRWNKVRNYVLGHQELGLDLTPVYDHFVASKLFPEATWEYLLEDPIGHVEPPTSTTPRQIACGRAPTPGVEDQSLEEIFDWASNRPRSLNQHLATLRKLAAAARHVTEFSRHRESAIALLAGQPAQLTSFNAEDDAITKRLEHVSGSTQLVRKPASSKEIESIEPTDLLVLNSARAATTLANELERFAPQVRRKIVITGTHTHGIKGEDSGPGLLTALHQYVNAHPEWFVCSHVTTQDGLTVLSRDPEDKPVTPIHLWPPGFGPGTELKEILQTLGINPSPACDCRARANQMDLWGVEGCRNNRETILQWMRDGQQRWGWKDKVAAATRAVTSGLAFKLNPLDPYPSLIDEAIRRAEEKAVAHAD